MSSVKPVHIHRFKGNQREATEDLLVVEEPLEIRVGYGPENDRKQLSLSVTMRTPGYDEELTMGFLFSEGVINVPSDLLSVKYCEDVGKNEQKENVMRAELAPHVSLDPAVFKRNFYTTSSCGVCGKTSIDQVRVLCRPIMNSAVQLDVRVLYQLPQKLKDAQLVFRHTGGLHAAALFDLQGELRFFREDVGRHNALDKVLGHLLLTEPTLAHHSVLLLSGRISFELVQKAARAGIPIIAAIGAPSSLAVQLGNEMGITLIGFLKTDKCNVYTHPGRVSE
jgi:FdhD protein